MNAADTAAALAAHAEDCCRRYLAHGRRVGRYWCAGDVRGAPGRSLFVRLEPPGPVGKWSDPAEQLHGDLLDLIRLATGARSLREALAEAHRFLAQPLPPASSRPDTYDRTEAARNLWNRCQPIDASHAEAYLRARGIHRCRFPALRFHPSLPYRPDAGGWRRYPALVAAVAGDDGELQGVHRTWLDPRRPAKAPVERPRKALGRLHGFAVRFGEPAAASTLLVGEGIETVLSARHRLHRPAARGQRFQRRPGGTRSPSPRTTTGSAARPTSGAKSVRLRRGSARNEERVARVKGFIPS